MEQPFTYQQILAQQYEENAKTILTNQENSFDDVVSRETDVDPQTHDRGVVLENQEAFRRFAGNRHLDVDIVKPQDFDDKSKLSVRYNKDVRTSVFNIDTRYRAFYTGDTSITQTVSANPNYISPVLSTASSLASHFIFRLSRVVKNAMSVKLTSLELPNKFYNISTARGNRSFGLRVTGISGLSFSGVQLSNQLPDGRVYLPSGSLASLVPGMSVTFYNFTTFGNIVQGTTYFIRTVGDSYVTLSNTLFEGSSTPFSVGVSRNTARMDVFTTVTVPDGYYNDANIHDRVTQALQSSGISGAETFTTTMDSMMRTTITASGYAYDFHFGNPATPQVYPTLLSMLGFYKQASSSVSGLALTTYLNAQTIVSEDPINTNVDPYIYLAINDWNTVEHQTKNDSFFTVFAKIPVSVEKGKVLYDNESTNTTTKTVRFLQPTNIQTLEIELLDGFGNQLTFNDNVNYSITLEIEEVLSQSLYEKLREL